MKWVFDLYLVVLWLLGCLLDILLLIITPYFYTCVGSETGTMWLLFFSHLRGLSKNCWEVIVCHPCGPSSSFFNALFYLRNKDLRFVLISKILHLMYYWLVYVTIRFWGVNKINKFSTFILMLLYLTAFVHCGIWPNMHQKNGVKLDFDDNYYLVQP